MCGQLARVQVGTATFLEFEEVSEEELLRHFQPGFMGRLLKGLFQRLQSLAPGRYLLTHESGARHVAIYRALQEDEIGIVRSRKLCVRGLHSGFCCSSYPPPSRVLLHLQRETWG